MKTLLTALFTLVLTSTVFASNLVKVGESDGVLLDLAEEKNYFSVTAYKDDKGNTHLHFTSPTLPARTVLTEQERQDLVNKLKQALKDASQAKNQAVTRLLADYSKLGPKGTHGLATVLLVKPGVFTNDVYVQFVVVDYESPLLKAQLLFTETAVKKLVSLLEQVPNK